MNRGGMKAVPEGAGMVVGVAQFLGDMAHAFDWEVLGEGCGKSLPKLLVE